MSATMREREGIEPRNIHCLHEAKGFLSWKPESVDTLKVSVYRRAGVIVRGGLTNGLYWNLGEPKRAAWKLVRKLKK